MNRVYYEPCDSMQAYIREAKKVLGETYGNVRNKKTKKLPPWSLSMVDVLEIIPVSDRTIDRWVKDGYFPKPITKSHLGKKNRFGKGLRRYWSLEEIDIWLDERVKESVEYFKDRT